MAINGKVGDGHRTGQIAHRSHMYPTQYDTRINQNTSISQFIDLKRDSKLFKRERMRSSLRILIQKVVKIKQSNISIIGLAVFESSLLLTGSFAGASLNTNPRK